MAKWPRGVMMPERNISATPSMIAEPQMPLTGPPSLPAARPVLELIRAPALGADDPVARFERVRHRSRCVR